MKLGSKLTFSPRVTPHIPGYADVQNSIRAFFKKSIMRECHVNHLQFIGILLFCQNLVPIRKSYLGAIFELHLLWNITHL